MTRSAVICRAIILLVWSSVARSTQPLKFPAKSNSEQLRNALVVSTNGEDSVYVGSSTSLYRLSGTLSEQAAHTSLTSFNAMLLVLEQANSLLACQRDSCLLLNATSLQNNQSVTPPTPGRLLFLVEDNVAVLTSSSSSGASLFVGKADASNEGDRLPSSISKLSLTVSGSPALSADAYIEESDVFRGRSFFTSFRKNGFAYFVSSIALTANAEREVRISRICSNDNGNNENDFTTYSEVRLNCDNGGSNDGGGTGTYYSATISDGQSGALVLLALHDKSQSTNFICSYDLSAIDSAMDGALSMCASGTGLLNLIRQPNRASCPTGLSQSQKDSISACSRTGLLELPIEVTTPITSTPLVAFPNSQPFQSLLLTELSGSTFIYAGSNGKLEQFHLNQSTPSASHIRSQTLENVQRNITELHSSTNREFVYALTSHNLFRYPVDVCSQYTSCDTCLMSGDPICGWCTLSRSCSRQVNCSTDPWIQGEVSLCPMIRQVDPSVVYIEQLSGSTVTLGLSVANIPSNMYECVFNYANTTASSVTMATMINETHINCMLPMSGELPQFPGQGTLFVALSLRTTSTDVVTVGGNTFGFTDCTVLRSCFQCLEASRGCQWCPSQRACKPPLENCDNSLQGQATLVCSFIEGPGGSSSNYLVHAAINKTLSIRSRNLQLFSGDPLTCVLSNPNQDTVFRLPAVLNNQTSEVQCRDDAFMYQQLSPTMPTVNLKLEVLVMTASGELSIENPNNIEVTLYSCSFLGLDCGQCLSVGDEYGCGYCRDPSNQCLLTGSCSSVPLTMVTEISQCGNPTIKSFTPNQGPTDGGTVITINGSNLGASRSDIDSVWIQEVVCIVMGYTAGRQIQCTTEQARAAVFSASISVNFTYNSVRATSPSLYTFRIPSLNDNPAHPSRGPRSGGTKVTISGKSLGIGSSRVVLLNGHPCIVDNPESINFDAQNFTCTTTAGGATFGGMGVVFLMIDNHDLTKVGFNYVEDPTISRVLPDIGFIRGGTNVTVTGSQLDVVQEPEILIYIPTNQVSRRDTSTAQPIAAGPCTATSSTVMQCTIPKVNMSLAAGENTSLTLGFRMDGVTQLLRLPNTSISYYGNPVFDSLLNNLELSSGSTVNVTIMGAGFVFTADQVQVTVAMETGSCEITRITVNPNGRDVLTCTLTIENNAQQGDHDISVVLGGIPETVGVVRIRLPLDPLFIIIPVFAFVVVVGVALFIVVVATLCHKYKKKDKQSDRLILELERLESSVAHECKQGFAELQTDLDEITGDLAGCRLPYHNFRLYIIRSLFPGQKDHSVLHGLQFPSHKRAQMERGLRDFVGLLHDKTVLLTMIHSLERQKQRFTIRDKSNVGSLLLIALHDRLDYATEILKSLLSDLVRRTVTDSHPKLLLRRTESVAEKMLSSWLVFTLHEYVKDHVGQPLYLLYKAVKSQLEKGPIDVITGEARYSLSEQKLIRQQIDVNVINATILADDANSELSVKLLDCDSISQAKEKILDALYKASHVSSRPALVAVDLEWKNSPKEGYILRDDDATNYSENGWRNINTLKHYHVPDNAVFRLVKRRDTPAPGRVFDYVGNLAVSPGTRSRTLSEADDGTRVWHLFKQVEEDPRSSPYASHHSKKMVTEIYLPRMLSTKTILQKFVDDLFRSMFSTSHPPSSPVSAFPSYPLMSPSQAVLRYTPGVDGLPTSVKYLFDFLDDEAMNAKIGDVDVVHMWKNNSIPLRFWVNLIKNPEFVFDINKSAVVDSSLSVIAQAIIDGCSTSESRPTINSPTSKLLYSKEVQGYKASVKRYYSDVQTSPRVSEDYVMQYLRELSAHQAKLFQHAGGFHPECAQYEILRYTMKYKDVIIEGLRGAGLEAKAQIFENVLQNVM